MTKKLIATFVALVSAATLWAATEVKATFSSLENGATDGVYTVVGNCISGGTAWTYTDYITVIVKYSGLPTSGQQAIVTFHQADHDDKAGVIANSSKAHGLWEGNAWGSDGSTMEASGTIIVVYAPSSSSGVTVYNSSGTQLYAASGLKASSGSFGDAINFGAKHDGSMKLSGFSVDAVQILKGAAQSSEVAGIVTAFEEAIKPTVPAVEPLMLLNVHNGTAVDGWLNHTQDGGPIIPNSGSLTTNGISFVTSSEGNFYKQRASGTSFQTGEFIGLDGKTYGSIAEEVSASLSLPQGVVFDSSVYASGVMNGGKINHTATLSGLDNTAKYLLYIGCGRDHADADYQSGFKFETSGCASVDELAYVNTDSTSYQTGNLDNDMLSTTDGLVIVRAKGIKPVNGTIQFKMVGGRSSLNFLAVAKMNDIATTAELSYAGDVNVSDINNDLKTTDNKAEVTLQSGATIYFDAELQVPTKLICEGRIMISANAKPTDLSKLDLSGVTDSVTRTWLTDSEKKGIGFNFASKRGPVTSAALVADAAWYDNNDGGSNDEGKNGANVAMSSDGLTTITWTSANTYDDDASTHGNNSSASMVRGYLDDANGVSIAVKNIPFAEYAVIIYASTDQSGKTLSFKKVNGKNYTYDSAHSDVATIGEDAWGACQSSSSVSYGRNAIRVIAQTAGTLTIESKRDDSKNVRGCISAIQIVPYSTFIPPEVIIASVESKCSDDYKSNTISGVMENIILNSWTGNMTARVVINSTVYESAAIKEKSFTIEVSDLTPEKVYRTNLEVGYTDDEGFKAVTTQPIALYQGERKFVRIASPFVIQEKTLVNEAQGLTIGNFFESPDYVDLCDSEYTVSISASEAVDAENDAVLDGTEQGGIRIAQTASGLKLQVVDKGDWVDFADAVVNTTYTLTVKFHYKKSQEGETDATSVTYTLDSTTKTSANTTGKLKVTEIFVSDGTNLAEDMFGACQLDSAVIVDIELKPGEGDTIDYNTEAEANAAIKTLKIGICDAVKGILTTETQQATYRSYFHLVVVPSKMLENGFSVKTEFTTEAKNEIEEDLEKALADVVNAFNTGSAEIVGKPGLYYGVKSGEDITDLTTGELKMADADGKVSITITKPEGASKHFYRIICSPTPASNK